MAANALVASLMSSANVEAGKKATQRLHMMGTAVLLGLEEGLARIPVTVNVVRGE